MLVRRDVSLFPTDYFNHQYKPIKLWLRSRQN